MQQQVPGVLWVFDLKLNFIYGVLNWRRVTECGGKNQEMNPYIVSFML